MYLGGKAWNKNDLDKIAKITNTLRNITFNKSQFSVVRSGNGLHVSTIAKTTTTATATVTKQPFQLDSVGTGDAGSSSSSDAQAGFYLNNNMGFSICRILGVQYDVLEGDNVEYDPLTDKWFCSPTPVQANFPDGDSYMAYVYLAFDRKNLTITLHANGFYPERRDEVDDHKEYIEYKLIYVYQAPSFSTTFNTDYFIDAREGYSVSGMI